MFEGFQNGNLDVAPNLNLRSLTDVSPLYFLPSEPLGEEVLIPAFSVAERVECMSGFFSSEALVSLAPGLATYINSSENSLRLIISPLLRPEDRAALEEGLKSDDQVLEETLEELIVTPDEIAQHTLRCLTWLIKARRIEIKVALMKDALFHPKVWLFQCGHDLMAVHGSSNMTYSGIMKNVEQVAVSQSWRNDEQALVTYKFREQFDRLWNNLQPECVVKPLPVAIEEKLVTTYSVEYPPREEELQQLYRRATGGSSEVRETNETVSVRNNFQIPSHLRYEDGPYKHQGKAVKAWCDAEYNGILEMATGSGKTITAMICAYRLYEDIKPLVIVVAAPYIPLAQQWCQEIELFGIRPFDFTKSGPGNRNKLLGRIHRRLRHGMSDVEAIVVTHRTLCNQEFQRRLSNIPFPKLLIADEAHNLGSESFIENPPSFKYRLGLSATPVRQYDDHGTAQLFSFFGDVVFRFTLKEAIGVCLVEYDYYVHSVNLTEDEMDLWFDLTHKIKSNLWRRENDDQDEFLTKLLRDRRAVLENAKSKISSLEKLLISERAQELRHTLIYASDKDRSQLQAVNALLNRHGVLFHQITHEETSDKEKTSRILQSFQDGTLQVLTAMRVLDEGINIPQIRRAYILASTTVERQWIQRRGRLLRQCPEIGKTHSEIHDFVTLPPLHSEMDSDTRSLIQSELFRVKEFASLARNAGMPDGPLPLIEKLVQLAYL